MASVGRILRGWRRRWALHVAAAGLLAAALCLFGIYASWSVQTGSTLTGQAPPLQLPADMVVLAPDWSYALAAPTFDLGLLASDSKVEASASAQTLGVRTRVLGPQGAQTLWGLFLTSELECHGRL